MIGVDDELGGIGKLGQLVIRQAVDVVMAHGVTAVVFLAPTAKHLGGDFIGSQLVVCGDHRGLMSGVHQFPYFLNP